MQVVFFWRTSSIAKTNTCFKSNLYKRVSCIITQVNFSRHSNVSEMGTHARNYTYCGKPRSAERRSVLLEYGKLLPVGTMVN